MTSKKPPPVSSKKMPARAMPVDMTSTASLPGGRSITRPWEEVPEFWNHYYSAYRPANFGVGGDAADGWTPG